MAVVSDGLDRATVAGTLNRYGKGHQNSYGGSIHLRRNESLALQRLDDQPRNLLIFQTWRRAIVVCETAIGFDECLAPNGNGPFAARKIAWRYLDLRQWIVGAEPGGYETCRLGLDIDFARKEAQEANFESYVESRANSEVRTHSR
jgi:hypothetical protein